MKIALITLHTPTKENTRGASALPYHLMKHRPSEFHDSIDVFSFNLNDIDSEAIKKIESELNTSISVIPLPKWYGYINRNPFNLTKLLLSKPVLSYLDIPSYIDKKIQSDYDAIWTYGEDIDGISAKFNDFKTCVITTPDCEALFYDRVISIPSKIQEFGSFFKTAVNYRKYLRLSQKFSYGNGRTYHLVGKEDRDFLKKINPNLNAVFLPHPHYEGIERSNFEFHDKIRLLIPGRYDFYAKEDFDIAMSVLLDNHDLAEYYDITFLGKGFEEWNRQLMEKGYTSKVIRFADVYNEELMLHDIQLSPITVGTGTKGKVLDAFINGLLVIGTLRALENIQVDYQSDCVHYETYDDLLLHLRQIPNMRQLYQQKRQNGYEKVRKIHNPSLQSANFFKLFHTN